MWREAIEHVVGCWTNERYSIDSKYWTLADRRVQPKPLQQPHPPIWGATTSDDGHAQVGELGLGSVLVRGRRVARRREEEDRHLSGRGGELHDADRKVRQQPGRDVHDGAVRAVAGRSVERGARIVRVVPEGRCAPDRAGRRVDGGTQAGARQLRLRGRHARPLRRRLARPALARVPRRLRCVRARERPNSASTRASVTRPRASTSCCVSSIPTRSTTTP